MSDPKQPQDKRVPLAIQKVEDFDKKKFVDDLTDNLVRLVNEQRAKNGLPPLKP